MNDSFNTDSLGERPGSAFRSRKTGSWLNQDSISEVVRFDQFSTIDWMQDELSEHKRRLAKQRANHTTTSTKERFLSVTLTWLVLGLMGVSIGIIAATLNIMTAWLASIRLGHCLGAIHLSKSLCCLGEEQCTRWVPWFNIGVLEYAMYICFLVIFLYTAAYIVKRIAPSAAGSGILEIKCIVSGFVMQGFLGWWTLLIKSIGLPLAIGLGLSVGKEGPSVHYAVCVGNCISKLFAKYRKLASKAREFLTATSAAGVAVAFGSPMGGVLFSMEEISSVFQLSTIWKSYFCALIAVTTLATINPFGTGQLVMFEVSYNTNWHYFEIPAYCLLGTFGGVYGIIVSEYHKRVTLFRKQYLGDYAIREVVTLAVLTASFSYFNQFLKLDMTETMEILFDECGTESSHPMCDPLSKRALIIVSLLFATAARMVLTIFTYGCKVPAGIFVPSMAAGATFGRAIGILMELCHRSWPESPLFLTCPAEGKCIIPGTYAFLGAAAALSGITHLTVTVVIIMFELTGALRYIVPTMIVVVVTKSINDRWGKGGIADQMIKFNGLPLIEANEDHHLGNASVVQAMTTATVVFPYGSGDLLTISQVKNILKSKAYRGFPIVQLFSDLKIVGYVSRLELQRTLNTYTLANDSELCDFSDSSKPMHRLLNMAPMIVHKEITLEYLMDVFVKLGPRFVLVEDDTGTLCGLVTRKDILRYEHSLHDLSKDRLLETQQKLFNAKVWDVMVFYNALIKKTFGKLLYNNEERFL